MCGCDYANHVHGLLEGFGLEQNRLSADLIFATIAVLRGKPHAQHDERSKDLSVQQFEALFDTGNKVTDAHMEEIATLTNKLANYCGEALGVVDANNMSDTDCRSALAVARDLAQKYQAAYEAERVANRYRGMQLGVAHEMTDKIRAATESLQHYVDENIEKFHTAKIANDALTECVSLCASKLRAEFGERRSRKGKKKPPSIVELEQLTESAISQFNNLKAKCESLAEELRTASANYSSVSSATLSSDLESRIAELTRQCAANDDQIEALSTKLRCSICEERDKDTAFACGHTLCSDCATTCAKCPLRCESERRHKPVKHTFRLYF